MCAGQSNYSTHTSSSPLYPRSLDGISPPTDELLKEFGFAEVNTAIANALTTIANTPATLSVPEAVTIEQVTHLIQEAKVELKGNLKQDVEQMKDEIVQETQTYTDIVTEQFKESLDTKFEEFMGLLSGIRNLLKNSTIRPTLGPPQGN
jgi:DNA anti-recombination protein RmuC